MSARSHSSDHFHALRHPSFHLNSHDAQPYRHVRHHRGKCVTQNCFHAPALMLSRHTQDLHSSPFRSREGTIGPDRANRIFRPRRESDVRASGLTVCLICPSLCIRKPAHVACVRRPSGPSGFPVREEVQYASLTVFRSPSKTRKKKNRVPSPRRSSWTSSRSPRVTSWICATPVSTTACISTGSLTGSCYSLAVRSRRTRRAAGAGTCVPSFPNPTHTACPYSSCEGTYVPLPIQEETDTLFLPIFQHWRPQ